MRILELGNYLNLTLNLEKVASDAVNFNFFRQTKMF